MKRLLLTATLALLAWGVAWAGPFEDGFAAHQRGDYATELLIMRPLAAQGNAEAQATVGMIYEEGLGVKQSFAEAFKWYRLAAAQENTAAQNNLGLMYESGAGVPQDYVEAVRWYRLAAAQGYGQAQFNLGSMYSNGLGVTQDYVQAHIWFNLAGASGEADGVKWREVVAARMTLQQVAEAQKLARACQQNNFKGCG